MKQVSFIYLEYEMYAYLTCIAAANGNLYFFADCSIISFFSVRIFSINIFALKKIKLNFIAIRLFAWFSV